MIDYYILNTTLTFVTFSYRLAQRAEHMMEVPVFQAPDSECMELSFMGKSIHLNSEPIEGSYEYFTLFHLLIIGLILSNMMIVLVDSPN